MAQPTAGCRRARSATSAHTEWWMRRMSWDFWVGSVSADATRGRRRLHALDDTTVKHSLMRRWTDVDAGPRIRLNEEE